jgi:hypothetical protein
MERCAEGVTDDLKDKSIVSFNRGLQDGMMALLQRLPLVGMSLREFGRAFNVREEEGHSAGGECHCPNAFNAYAVA